MSERNKKPPIKSEARNLSDVFSFYNSDIVAVEQFQPSGLDAVFGAADEMRTIVNTFGGSDLLSGKIMTNLFYEPSTRTSSSFMAAMFRLGGQVIPINSVEYSSVSKGENLADTVRTLESYSNVIVLRHPEEGAALEASRCLSKPLINAGDGAGQHPTQALLDAYTIKREIGSLEGITVGLLGDLWFGRTVHSLAKLLVGRDIKFKFISPESLGMPEGIKEELREAGNLFTEHRDLGEVIGDLDVLYATRIQKERFTDPKEYEKLKGSYVITPDTMSEAKKDMVLMHPFPRVGEISPEVDSDPRAAYFRQMENGLYVRMALLALVLGKYNGGV